MLVPIAQTVDGITRAVSMWLSGRQHLDRQVGKVSLMASLMSEMLRPASFVATQLLIYKPGTHHSSSSSSMKQFQAESDIYA
jgi:hypothetical protein